MNHDALIAVFMLVSIPPLFLVMAWSKNQQSYYWKHSHNVKEKMFMARLPHAVHLWRNLLEAVRDNKSEEEKTKCAKEVYEHIKLMTK